MIDDGRYVEGCATLTHSLFSVTVSLLVNSISNNLGTNGMLYLFINKTNP